MTPPSPSGPERSDSIQVGTSASRAPRLLRPMQVIVVSSVMFTFIGYWRTAAVVLCDLASTAYYIGGIVESSIGPAAPWFILAVMIFSYAVRSVYIESCSLFVRGGVYRVVKEAMGGFLGKLSVSALMFDYILTGPTSGVAAGQYFMGLLFQILKLTWPNGFAALSDDAIKWYTNWGSVLLAVLVTLYFFRQNLLGIHESSDKALKIMIATTIMGVVMLTWCLVTLAVRGPVNSVPWQPDLEKKFELETRPAPDRQEGETWIKNPRTGKLLLKLEHGYKEIKNDQGQVVDYEANDPEDKPIPRKSEALAKLGVNAQEDPLGFLDRILPKGILDDLRHPTGWLRLLGVIGLVIAFGHSILAMSGEETLAQVYREVESPKMKNFQKAAFIVFVYSLVLTGGISFLAVLLIPDDVRMKAYDQNLISGLSRYVLGDPLMKVCLEAFVVIVGFLILSGAVNTAIIGSNGVLNRVAEDGVLPDWFLKPHPRYGTTYRLLWLILALQLAVILFSRGDMIVLGEAYAFGVVWSFVFKALAMVVLRFKDRSPRAYRVPFNLKLGSVEVPFGLLAIFFVLLSAAILNFFTKEVATVGGLAFTLIFLGVFMVSERYHEKRLAGVRHEHLEQFNRATAPAISAEGLGLKLPYRKLVSIRSVRNLFMLEKALAETDPQTTDLVVMTAKVLPVGEQEQEFVGLDSYDQHLMTAVVTRAESAGKQVHPVIVPTNNPLHAVLQTAKDLGVNELVLGASNKNTADEQLEQVAFYWISLHGGTPAPLTVRILGRDRDVNLDLGGGNRIPKMSERQARSVAELRESGVGIDRVLLAHDGSRGGSDLFQAVLTMLDPKVSLALLPLAASGKVNLAALQEDQQRANQLDRPVPLIELKTADAREVVTRARELQFDLIILPLPPESPIDPLGQLDERSRSIVRNAHCRVLLVSVPAIPQEVVDTTPSA